MLASTALISVEEALTYLDRPIGEDAAMDDSRVSKLEFLINGVSTYFRNFLDRPLRNETIEEWLDGSGSRSMMLSQYPIVSVDEVTVHDGSSVVTIGSESDLYVYKGEGKIMIRENASISTFTRLPQAVHVTYVAGYAANVEDVPWDLKQAAIEAVRHLYLKEDSNPSSIFSGETVPKYLSSKMPTIVREYLQSYKRIYGSAI